MSQRFSDQKSAGFEFWWVITTLSVCLVFSQKISVRDIFRFYVKTIFVSCFFTITSERTLTHTLVFTSKAVITADLRSGRLSVA
jgi:hypothetical protein